MLTGSWIYDLKFEKKISYRVPEFIWVKVWKKNKLTGSCIYELKIKETKANVVIGFLNFGVKIRKLKFETIQWK